MYSSSLGKKSSTKKSYRSKLVKRRNKWLACMKPSDPMVDTLTSTHCSRRRRRPRCDRHHGDGDGDQAAVRRVAAGGGGGRARPDVRH